MYNTETKRTLPFLHFIIEVGLLNQQSKIVANHLNLKVRQLAVADAFNTNISFQKTAWYLYILKNP